MKKDDDDAGCLSEPDYDKSPKKTRRPGMPDQVNNVSITKVSDAPILEESPQVVKVVERKQQQNATKKDMPKKARKETTYKTVTDNSNKESSETSDQNPEPKRKGRKKMKKNDDVDYQPKPDNEKSPKRTRRSDMPDLVKNFSMVSDEHSRGIF